MIDTLIVDAETRFNLYKNGFTFNTIATTHSGKLVLKFNHPNDANRALRKFAPFGIKTYSGADFEKCPECDSLDIFKHLTEDQLSSLCTCRNCDHSFYIESKIVKPTQLLVTEAIDEHLSGSMNFERIGKTLNENILLEFEDKQTRDTALEYLQNHGNNHINSLRHLHKRRTINDKSFHRARHHNEKR